MSTPLIIIAFVVLGIFGAGTAVTYQALWKVWRATSSEQRRRTIVVALVLLPIGVAGLVLLIIAPWGTKDTILYLFGGTAALAVLCVFVGLLGAAVQHLLRSRRQTS